MRIHEAANGANPRGLKDNLKAARGFVSNGSGDNLEAARGLASNGWRDRLLGAPRLGLLWASGSALGEGHGSILKLWQGPGQGQKLFEP